MQINPSLLAKKDRGRNADLGKAPLEYGASAIPDRIEVSSPPVLSPAAAGGHCNTFTGLYLAERPAQAADAQTHSVRQAANAGQHRRHATWCSIC